MSSPTSSSVSAFQSYSSVALAVVGDVDVDVGVVDDDVGVDKMSFDSVNVTVEGGMVVLLLLEMF